MRFDNIVANALVLSAVWSSEFILIIYANCAASVFSRKKFLHQTTVLELTGTQHKSMV